MRRPKFEWSEEFHNGKITGHVHCYINDHDIGGIYLSGDEWIGYSYYALDKGCATPELAKRQCEDVFIEWLNGIKYKRPNK